MVACVPNLPLAPAGKKVDAQVNAKHNRKLFNAANVVATVACSRCAKPRCVFGAPDRESGGTVTLESYTESIVPMCGEVLIQHAGIFPGLYVRQGVSCDSKMEAEYYITADRLGHEYLTCIYLGCLTLNTHTYTCRGPWGYYLLYALASTCPGVQVRGGADQRCRGRPPGLLDSTVI